MSIKHLPTPPNGHAASPCFLNRKPFRGKKGWKYERVAQCRSECSLEKGCKLDKQPPAFVQRDYNAPRLR